MWYHKDSKYVRPLIWGLGVPKIIKYITGVRYKEEPILIGE